MRLLPLLEVIIPSKRDMDKNRIAATIVALVKKMETFVPKMVCDESPPPKVSLKPPPRPAWRRITAIKMRHEIT